jgi:hypothetical protein
MYLETFRQMKKMLGQFDRWSELAEAHAKEKNFSPDLYAGFRLAPDQFAFARQVQIACDTAKLGASRLAGKDAPKNDDSEKTLAELAARVHATMAYLDTFTAADFADTATRSVTQPRWEGKVMTGADYFLQHVVPNFFFHLSQAYAILRHNGVAIGKRDYLGALDQRAP